MATATWVREELDRRGIAYQELRHPDAYTAQEVALVEHTSGHRVAKVVCALADGQPVALVLPAGRKVRLGRVSEVLWAREVRLATEDELGRYFTACEAEAVPALRHWPGVEVIMDGHLCCGGDILLLGGTRRDAVRVRFEDWLRLVRPRVEFFSEPA
jgi:Ala-tRNA(Pro) deacylase